eukprot:3667174-Rhodomonas_salina.1
MRMRRLEGSAGRAIRELSTGHGVARAEIAGHTVEGGTRVGEREGGREGEREGGGDRKRHAP